MNDRDLNRAVARATGETVDRIQRMGFNLIGHSDLSAGQLPTTDPAIRPFCRAPLANHCNSVDRGRRLTR